MDGVLLVADRRLRRFSRDDLHFLQALANVVGAAVDRAGIDEVGDARGAVA